MMLYVCVCTRMLHTSQDVFYLINTSLIHERKDHLESTVLLDTVTLIVIDSLLLYVADKYFMIKHLRYNYVHKSNKRWKNL